jgi:GNAT superfamily N-acetyltransferase
VDVRELNGDEWQLKRDLRLAALNESPDAFASTYAREVHRSEAEWRVWPSGGAFFTAFESIASIDPESIASIDPAPGGDGAPGDLASRDFAPAEFVHAGAARGGLPAGGAAAGGAARGGGAAVAPVHGEPLGIAGAWVEAASPDTTHLISMWVAPDARGRRVAAHLVEAVAGWARERGHHTVELEVAAGNRAALTAYLRCGFVVTQREPFTPGGTVLLRSLEPSK